jgi:integrase
VKRRRVRRSGKGHVKCRNGVWQLDYYSDGRRHRESAKTTKRSVAQQRLSERLAYARPSSSSADLRLSAILDALIGDYVVRGRRSVGRVRICAAHLVAHFGADRLVRTIGTAEVDEYQSARLHAGRGPGTARLEAAVLRRALNLAALLGRVPHVPKIRLLPAPPPRSGFVERPELDLVLAHLSEDERPAILAAFLTAWRTRSELLTREWRHVTFDSPAMLRLDVGTSKTGAGREYPLMGELLDVVTSQRAKATELERSTGRPVPWVFFRADGRPLKGISSWRHATTTAGLPGLRLHDLRRSHCRALIRSGVASQTALALCGWKTRAMLDRYFIQEPRLLLDAVSLFCANQPHHGHTTPALRDVPASPEALQIKPKAASADHGETGVPR